jgi:hypothetical protein
MSTPLVPIAYRRVFTLTSIFVVKLPGWRNDPAAILQRSWKREMDLGTSILPS